MNSEILTPQREFPIVERECCIDLVGDHIWNLLLAIEQFSETWVVHGVPHKHTYGRLPREEEIRAWAIPRSTGYWLHTLIRLTGAKTVFEIGGSLGYSALWMASALMQNQGRIYTCEIFPPKIEIAKRNFAESGLRNIQLLCGDAVETARCWKGEIDVLFLDADPENYSVYWSALKSWLHRDSILIMDNAVDHRSVTEPFIKEIASESGWMSWIAPFDHGLLFAKQK